MHTISKGISTFAIIGFIKIKKGMVRGLLVPFDGGAGVGSFLTSGEGLYEYTMALHPKNPDCLCFKLTVPSKGWLYIISETLANQDTELEFLGR